ncbi:MAG: response regulator transcription factor [Gammaproteobacteria bacterium]|nr:response regulator transcription factor [Gammaproteobacteria bacterium]
MNQWTHDSMQASKRFLVIEDEQDIAELIALHLTDLNAEVTQIHNGSEGLDLALARSWDAIILDLRLPGMDGIDVCRSIRNQGRSIPIIMLTARSTELNRVLGLEIGADDYLTKPFSSLELQARVKALLRRSSVAQQSLSKTDAETHIVHGSLEINKKNRIASLNNQTLELTATEFELLCFFAEHPNVVFKRSELLDRVWGYHHQGYEHTVNSHINRLRSKLEVDPSSPQYIHTVWGVGYRFQLVS